MPPPPTTTTTHRLHLPDGAAATAESETHAPPPPPHLQSKSNTKLLSIFLRAVIMMSITSIFFLLMGLVSLILIPLLLSSLHRHHHHHHHHHRHNRNNIHTHRIPSNGLAPNRLKKLPQFKFSKQSETLNLGNDCAICLDGFKQGQSCRELIGCGHVLHRNCVDTWLLKVAACPLCRTPVRLEDEIRASFDETRSDSDSTSWVFLDSGSCSGRRVKSGVGELH